jgi:MFS family permease
MADIDVQTKTNTTTEHIDMKNSTNNSEEELAPVFSSKQLRSIRRRIDSRLLPTLGLMYGMSLMDRGNLPNASIAGMTVDLKLNVAYRYSLISMIFFTTYILLHPVAVVMCRKIGPRTFLPGICLLWGAVIIGFGFAKHWTVMIPLRLILGALEAGYFPGCVYMLSTWYTRYSVAKRYSVFYLTGNLTSAFSNILAYGLSQMEGSGGLRGWRWIFIMEGILTCAVAIFGWIFLVRFPDEELSKPSTKFLQPDEIKHVVSKIQADRGDVEPEPFNWAKFVKPAKEFEIWCFASIMGLSGVNNYSFSFFLPIILRQTLGYSYAMAQCLAAPPYVLAAILMLVVGWAGDRWKVRAPLIMFNATLAVIGLAIMGFAPNPSAKYFGAFLGVAGGNANVPTSMAYQANNIRGQWKRAFCSASLTALGGIGGVIGSLVFRTQDSPQYIPGFSAVLV